jgi:hypothetical protein
LACGETILSAPEAKTRTRLGTIHIVTEWRICSCGAFAKWERVRRVNLSA